MIGFYESLTAEERVALSHLALSYLDDVLPSDWDENKTRLDHAVTIEGKEVIVQGFENPHFGAKTYTLRGVEAALDEDQIVELSKIANYRQKESFDLEEYRQPAYGTLMANQSNGLFDLFDHPVQTQRAISLEISDARLHGDLDGKLKVGEEVRIMGDKATVNIQLAPEQYVRFVRSQRVKVPCTISRRGGYLNDALDQSYLTAIKEANDVHVKTSEAVSVLGEVAQQVIDLLGSGKMTSPKRFAEVETLLNQVEEAYRECFKSVNEAQAGAVSRVQENFMQRMIDQVELEVQALPNDQKQQVLHLLKDMSKDL